MTAVISLLTLVTAFLAQASSAAGTTPRPERVRIETPSGAVLIGQYMEARRGAPAVLFFHMCRTTAIDGWRPVADRLQTAGITTLIVSPPGYSGSTASPTPRAPWVPEAAAALAYLRSRVGSGAPVATAGASCGVSLALGAAATHPEGVRAVVLLSGPNSAAQLEHVRRTPALAVFSGASEGEPPSPEWARALKNASAHPSSRVTVFEGQDHGTDRFQRDPTFARTVADWIVDRLQADNSDK